MKPMRSLRILCLATVIMMSAALASAVTPAEVMRSVIAGLTKSGGLAGNFRISGEGGNVSGKFKFDGRRSYIEVPGQGISWYDGHTMWSLNQSAREVTVSTPDGEEAMEANPLLYLDGCESRYRLYFSRRKEPGKYLVLLNPRGREGNVKAIEVTVDVRTMRPERMIVRDSDDRRVTMTLSGLKTGAKPGAGDFTFPAGRYKGYEIIDLR